MDYHDIAMSIADTIEKVAEPITADQRAMLVGAIAPWLLVRDERIAGLEKALRQIAEYKPSDGGLNGASWAADMKGMARRALGL